MTLRAAVAEALPFLADCFLRSMRESVSASRGLWDEAREREQFEDQLDLDHTWIIASKGVDVGFVTVLPRHGFLHIYTLCVLPEHQGRGHGSEAVRRVISQATRTGRGVVLSVLKTNPRAQALYERLGFEVVNESKHHRHMRHAQAGRAWVQSPHSPLLAQIPFDRLEVVLLDVGGTLMSMDFSWIQQELERRQIACTRDQLERAEALARPLVSRENTELLRRSESAIGFERFLTLTLERLEPLLGRALEPPRLAAELAPVLRPAGQSDRLWSAVLPGVREALADFRAMGLRLAVVSNADGTVETGLERQGLRHYFELVVDSAHVGHEKPDPRIFSHALTALACQPDHALHIGDMYFADIAGARSAGIHALLLDPFDDWPDMDCPRLPSLLEVRDHFFEAIAKQRGAR